MNKLSAVLAPAQEMDEVDFSLIAQQIWAKKWLILFISLIMLVIGHFIASMQIPQYESDILLEIQQNNKGGSGLSGRLSSQIIFSGRNDAEATQIALLKSRYVLSPVIGSLGLNISAAPKQSPFMRYLSPSKATVEVGLFDVPQNYVQKKFSLIFEESNHFSLYDDKGALLLNGLVGRTATNKNHTIRLRVDAAYRAKNTSFSLIKKSETTIIESIASRLKIIDMGDGKGSKGNTGVLTLSITDSNPKRAALILNSVANTLREKNIQKNAAEASQMLDFLEQQLPITKKDLSAAETDLNRYRSRNGKIDIKLQAESLLHHLSDIDKQLSEVRINKIDMLQRHTKNHPFIIALDKKAHELTTVRNRLQSELKALPASDQIAVNLIRDVEVKSNLYTVLLNKIQEQKVLNAGIISDVNILSLAKPSYAPLALKSPVIYLASVLIGFFVSIIIIFTRKIFFSHVTDPLWSEKYFNLVNLATIPYSKEQALNIARY